MASTLLKYSELVEVDMSADNDVNFADVEDYGHRLIIECDKAAMTAYLGWERAAGADRPTAKLTAAAEADFVAALVVALNSSYDDIDGVTGGLHFGTSYLDGVNSDPRLRASGVSANDIPLAFVLYKLYGSSGAQTLNVVFNLEDSRLMITSAAVAQAIVDSIKGAEAGATDMMFRDLLAACPNRFFDASGIPFTGIFETNADVSGSGSWPLIQDDIIEIKTKFVFKSKVTRRGVAGREHDLGLINENEQDIISPEDYFYVRLQFKATEGAGSGGSGGAGGVVITSVTNGGDNTDSDVTDLVNAAKPIVLDSSNSYTNVYAAPYYSIVYDPVADELLFDASPTKTIKLSRVSGTKTYKCYFDLYNRGNLINQLTITVA
jgi:hypothetical protein